MAIRLPDETRSLLMDSLKRYFDENLDEDIGDLKAGLFLDYCLTEIGPSIYNQAVADAQAYFQEKVTDVDGICHEEELTYWPDAERRRPKS